MLSRLRQLNTRSRMTALTLYLQTLPTMRLSLTPIYLTFSIHGLGRQLEAVFQICLWNLSSRRPRNLFLCPIAPPCTGRRPEPGLKREWLRHVGKRGECVNQEVLVFLCSLIRKPRHGK